jgi:hypothetical protein
MKKIFFILIIAISTTSYANIEAIDFSKFPSDQQFRNEIDQLFKIITYVDHFTPDWKYPVTKDDLINQLKKLEKQTAEKISSSPKNIDLRLFQILLLHYLYNLNENENAKIINEKIITLKKNFPNEYRPFWLYGEHLAQAAKPVEAINEYKLVLNYMHDKTKLHPAFLENYSEACYFSGMFKSALDALEIASKKRNKPIDSYGMYKSLNNIFITSNIDAKYEKNECWTFAKTGNQYVIISRMLGLKLIVNKLWRINYTDYQNRKAALIITPEKLTNENGKSIGITVALFPITDEVPFDKFIDSSIKNFKVIKKEKKIINGQTLLIYEYDNPEIYKDLGGSHGYYAFIKLSYPEKPGLKIEVPLGIVSSGGSGGQIKYFRVKDIPDRFKHDVKIGIMLDSCNDIFKESSKLYFDLLENIIFE